jgi:hypothetical protein
MEVRSESVWKGQTRSIATFASPHKVVPGERRYRIWPT